MFNNLKNEFDFFIRNKTKLSRKNFIEKDPKLIERNRLENLYTKDILSKHLSKKNKPSLKILDIGSKNWFYAKGEYDFFNSFCKNIQLDGIEIDAYRLYSNFYSRYEVAKFHTKELKNTNYIAGNLLDLQPCQTYDYIIWFLPFVVIEPHEFWGLPKNLFYPEKLLAHAYKLLKEDGEMLIINQGADEASAQENLLKNLKINYKKLENIKSCHFEYKYERFGFLIKK